MFTIEFLHTYVRPQDHWLVELSTICKIETDTQHIVPFARRHHISGSAARNLRNEHELLDISKAFAHRFTAPGHHRCITSSNLRPQDDWLVKLSTVCNIKTDAHRPIRSLTPHLWPSSSQTVQRTCPVQLRRIPAIAALLPCAVFSNAQAGATADNGLLSRDLLPRPTPVTTVANSVHKGLVVVTGPMAHALAVDLQQEAILCHWGEPWATAQDHPRPTSACAATLACAFAWISGALERAIATLLPKHVWRIILASLELHVRSHLVL